MTDAERQPHAAAYQRLKETIARTYPRGWFVAIADERIVAAAADFWELKDRVRAEGFDPRDVLVVEAGVEDLDFVNIFAHTGD